MERAISKKIRIQLGEWSDELELWNIEPAEYRQHAIEFMKLRSQHEGDTLWEELLEVEEIREEAHEFSRL